MLDGTFRWERIFGSWKPISVVVEPTSQDEILRSSGEAI